MRLRRSIQSITTLLNFSYWKVFSEIGIYGGALKCFSMPVLQCYACPLSVFACPIGSLQYFIIAGIFPHYILGLLLVVGITVGRMSCGWLCPFGLLQDMVYKLGKIKLKIPSHLLHVRYLTLFFMVGLLPFLTEKPWFCQICPVGELEGGIPFVIWDSSVRGLLFDPSSGQFIGWWFLFKLFILVFFLVLMSVSKRPFCKILCPLGAFFSLFNKFSIIKLSINNVLCHECESCSLSCPVDLNVPKKLDSPDCVRCMNCTSCHYIKINIFGKEIKKSRAYGQRKKRLEF